MSQLALYRAFMTLGTPALSFVLARRARAGKEDPARLCERWGRATLPRPEGRLIWVHGASVGETVMLLPVIERAVSEGANVLVTSGTVTSAALMQKRLPRGAIHQFIPVDTPGAARRFISHWRPEAAIFAESDIWPNLLAAAKKNGTKLALINARLSPKSLSGWSRRGALARAVFGHFDLILAGNPETAAGLSAVLGKAIATRPNLKYAPPAKARPLEDFGQIKHALAGRPVWCAASTHAGEDEIVIDAHQKILAAHPGALLILVPRHPERADAIASLLGAAGLGTARRSLGQWPDKAQSVFLLDTLGELDLAYRLSARSLIGGSLIEGLSGHNPLEPTREGSAVMSGPYIDSFADIYADFAQAGGAVFVSSADDIAQIIADDFAGIGDPKAAAAAAKAVAVLNEGVIDRVWADLGQAVL